MRPLLGVVAAIWLLAASPVAAAETPEQVVRQMLDAQVRGDIDAICERWAMVGKTEEARKRARKVFEAVGGKVAFSNLAYEPEATVIGDRGTVAVVRGVVVVSVTNGEGTLDLKQGLMAILSKIDEVWKVTAVAPDDLLNLEIALEIAEASAERGRLLADAPVRIKEINAALNKAMEKGYINEEKLALDGLFATIGKVPGVGDAVANIYQVCDTVAGAGEVLQELWNYGPYSGLLLVKGQQVALGVAQIVTEITPGLDTGTDAMAASLEQLAYNLQIQRALQELKKQLLEIQKGEIELRPRLFPVAGFDWECPAGIEFSPNEEDEHAYGKTLNTVTLMAPEAIGQRIPFQVIGELPIDSTSPVHEIAEKLGAARRGENYYLPVDVGHLAEAEVARGDMVFDGWSRRRTEASTSRWATWESTCRRGVQQIAVRIRGGEETAPVRVVNSVMNEVRELEIRGAPAPDRVKLRAGSKLSGIRVIGKAPDWIERTWPDLTGRAECLDMAIEDPSVAKLNRGESVSVEGVKKGQTSWSLLLGGSIPESGVAEVSRSIPVEVEEANVAAYARFRLELSGPHKVRYHTGNDGTISEILSSHNDLGKIAITWDGPRFKALGSSGGIETALEGRVDSETKKLTELKARTTVTMTQVQGSWTFKTVTKMEFTAADLASQSWDARSARWYLKGQAASVVRTTGSRERFENNKLVPDRSWEYMGTDWNSPTAQISITFSTP